MLLSLIIPTYNEKQNIIPLIQQVTLTLEKALDQFEIIVVDDDSPDGTWQAAAQLAKDNPRVKVIRRLHEKGLATAAITGWKAGRGKFLGVMDGDLQHPVEVLPVLLRTILDSHADIVVASRNVDGGGVSEWRPMRRLIGWGARSIAVLLLPGIVKSVRDPLSGYFFMKRTVIESVTLRPVGYKTLLEVLARGKYQAVVEVPYVFEERKNGRSKLGPKQCLDFFIHLWRLRLQQTSKICQRHF
jgi:dolichol-phosphate mannosyltransferase